MLLFPIFRHVDGIDSLFVRCFFMEELFDSFGLLCQYAKNTQKIAISDDSLTDVVRFNLSSKNLKLTFIVI